MKVDILTWALVETPRSLIYLCEQFVYILNKGSLKALTV